MTRDEAEKIAQNLRIDWICSWSVGTKVLGEDCKNLDEIIASALMFASAAEKQKDIEIRYLQRQIEAKNYLIEHASKARVPDAVEIECVCGAKYVVNATTGKMHYTPSDKVQAAKARVPERLSASGDSMIKVAHAMGWNEAIDEFLKLNPELEK